MSHTQEFCVDDIQVIARGEAECNLNVMSTIILEFALKFMRLPTNHIALPTTTLTPYP